MRAWGSGPKRRDLPIGSFKRHKSIYLSCKCRLIRYIITRLGPLAQQESGVLIRPRSGGQHTDGPPTLEAYPSGWRGRSWKPLVGFRSSKSSNLFASATWKMTTFCSKNECRFSFSSDRIYVSRFPILTTLSSFFAFRLMIGPFLPSRCWKDSGAQTYPFCGLGIEGIYNGFLRFSSSSGE